MTKEEHQLIIAMFARLYEGIEIAFDTFKSRGLWSEDDAQAFSAAVHADTLKTFGTVAKAQHDYLRFAQMLGVETGIEGPPA